jgi:hypothetical protein
MISTSIDGTKLKFYFHPSPVGDAKYTGPKLELLNSRTSFEYGDYCSSSAPTVIPPNGFGDIIIGDSYWGMASAVCIFYIFSSAENWIQNASIYQNTHTQKKLPLVLSITIISS